MPDSPSPARERAAALAEPDLRDAALYRYWRRATLRFSDLDHNGHVNNVAFAVLFQEGRTSLLREAREAAGDAAMAFSVARLTIDFLNELHIPGEVEIGTRILRVGRSSLILGQGLFRDGQCAATSCAVMVRIDRAARASRPIADEERRWLDAVAAGTQS